MDHNFCVFYKHDRMQYGWIKELRKNKLVVIPETGNEVLLSNSQIEYSWKGKSVQSAEEAIQHIKHKEGVVDDLSEGVDIGTIYELCDLEKSYTLEELATDFLDQSDDDGWEKIALLKALKQHSRLFKGRKGFFTPRHEDEIAKIDLEEEKKQRKEKRENQEKEWSTSLLDGVCPNIEDEVQEHWNDFLARLNKFLVYLEQSQEKKYFVSLFNFSLSDAVQLERQGISLLQLAEYPTSWGRLLIERAGVHNPFSTDQEQQVATILEQSIEQSLFSIETKDQTSLEVYSVDNEGSKDFDDALSWEKTSDGFIIRVHITDVASFLAEDSPLFKEASHRVASVYTLKEIFPMLPKELSEKHFSLIENQNRAVMTFDFDCDEDGNIRDYEIYRSIIKVRKNLTYQNVDDEIQGESPFWIPLWEFAQKQKQIRIENGALDLERKEIKLDISNPEEIQIQTVRTNSPSSALIQELAILTNSTAAQFCQTNELVGAYRTQAPYTITRELEEGEKPTLQDLQIKGARISLQPSVHSGLGVDSYIQATSPIRRFIDLITQKSIFYHLAEEKNLYSEDDLLPWAKTCEETQKEYTQLERALISHWKLKYLAQHIGDEFNMVFAFYLKNGKALVRIYDLDFSIDLALDGIEEKEEFIGKIEQVNSDYHRLVISKVEKLEDVANELS
ncbi:MAG: exoribonuclease-2 [bacterium]|jgi:exoribonuclease-2